MSDSVKISSLEMENVKRVRAFALEPRESGLTVIGGRNCQGKTSVLDGIAYALGGEKYRPSSLQNSEGMAPARMEVRLSNGLVVTRDGAKAALRVRDPQGLKAGQKLLDSLIGELAIDLPKFMQAPANKKAEMLLSAWGCKEEMAKLDAQERKLYDERTLVGRDADRKAKFAEELPEYPDAPEEPVSVAELTARLSQAMEANARIEVAKRNVEDLRRCVRTAEVSVEQLERQMRTLAEQLRQWRDSLEEQRRRLAEAEAEPVGTLTDLGGIQMQIEGIEAINNKVRANLDKANALDVAAQCKATYDRLTAEIEDARIRRKKLLDGFSTSLPGLAVEGGELMYGGRKWDCMSTMEQMRAAVAVCRLTQPKCGFVLLDHLEAFDPSQLAEFGEWLKGQGLQCIATRVATDDTCDIIIEDGVVAGAEPGVPSAPAELPEEEDW